MTQGAILRWVISAATEVVNPGSIQAYPATRNQQHLGDVYVRSKVLILGDRDCGDTVGVDANTSSVAREGHEGILEVVVGLYRQVLAVNACVDMVRMRIIRPMAGALPIVGAESQHGGQRNSQELTDPALPFAKREGHDPILDSDTGQPCCWREVQLAGLRTLSHGGAQYGMTRVSNIGVGGGLKHLRELEFPEDPAANVGGRLIGLHMW